MPSGKTDLRAEDIEEILEIGVALAAERDLNVLLERILEKSRQIVTADAGSLFLAEGPTLDQPTHLRFKLAQNDSVPIQLEEFVIPLDSKSLVGYVGETRKALALEDVYRIPKELPSRFNVEIDQKTGYRSKSLISVPMLDHQDQLIGVVQLWNKKRDPSHRITPENVEERVIPFSESDHKLLASLSAQAGVSIENARLYQDIENLFQGFIRASVTAIEARDPTTFGHSERVATLTVDLCEIVNRVDTGPYASVHFSTDEIREIKYAALLHDFGKIGVKEAVLQKGKKLFATEAESLWERLNLLHRTVELEVSQQKLNHLLAGGKPEDETWKAYEAEHEKKVQRLERAREVIREANEPSVLPEAVTQAIGDLSELMVKRPDGSTASVVTPDQIRRLAIPKGSLSPEERFEIESHVTHTYQFLSRIPWTRDLRKVADIAYAHHEKMDGSGYPRRIRSEGIPLPARIMTIADIFDALAARDRPYKKALPVEKALDILKMEAKQNKLDPELVRLFIETKVYRLTLKDR